MYTDSVQFMKNKRVYVFDWDDNIIHMPTTIKMEVLLEGVWELIDISTQEYSKIRGNSNYRYPIGVANPYLNFRSDSKFIEDLTLAISNKSFGPSFSKFKECLMYGNDFSIITARGQDPNTIMMGIVMLIGSTFYPDELTTMITNVGNIANYLRNQIICPVSSDKMSFPQISESGLEDSIEVRKILALDSYIDTKMNDISEVEFDGKFSIGISDDDAKNINTIKDFIEKAMKSKYPNIHFVIYDTSNPENIIKRPI